jgi:hypothetical protein
MAVTGLPWMCLCPSGMMTSGSWSDTLLSIRNCCITMLGVSAFRVCHCVSHVFWF